MLPLVFSELFDCRRTWAANSFGFTLIVPIEEVDRVERTSIWKTHSVTGDADGDCAYSVIKAPEMVQFGDPSKGMTGNMIYMTNVETPNGLAKHLAQVASGLI